MFVHEIGPIDSFWEQLKTVSETAGEIARAEAEVRVKGGHPAGALPDSAEFMRAWESAKASARDAGWEGDFRNEPVVFWIPTEYRFDYGFVIKQDNNGTTYVVSPVKMPWLNV